MRLCPLSNRWTPTPCVWSTVLFMSDIVKHCPDCGEDKPQSEFFKSKNGSQGLSAYCRLCNNLRGKKARGTDGRVKEIIPEGMGRCGRCKELKPLDKFYVKKNGKFKTQCKQCDNFLTRRYQATTRGESTYWNSHLLRCYGITSEQYDAIWAEQKGLCKICSRDLTVYPPDFDHCHATGLPRGILCHSCNCSLGHRKDKPLPGSAAERYLLEAQAANGSTPDFNPH